MIYPRDEKGRFIKGVKYPTQFSKENRPWRPSLYQNPHLLLIKMRRLRRIGKVAEEFNVNRHTIARYVNKYKIKEILKKEDEKLEQMLEREDI